MLVYDLHVAKEVGNSYSAANNISNLLLPAAQKVSRGPLFCAPSPSGVRMHLFRSVPATIFLAGAITVQVRSAPKPDLASADPLRRAIYPSRHAMALGVSADHQRVPPEDDARELLLLRQIPELPSSTGPAAIATASRRSTSLLITRG